MIMIKNCFTVAALLTAASTSALAQIKKPERAPLGRERVVEQRRDNKLGLDKGGRMLAAGSYILVLTPAKLDGRPTPRSVKPIASSVSVTSSGSKLAAKNADGLSLSGSSSGARFTLTGSSGDGKLVLNGNTANGGADGDFALTFSGGPRVEGNFVLAPPNSAGIEARQQLQDFDEAQKKKKKKADCNWWCTIKGWFTL
jgi:hypothetical protein